MKSILPLCALSMLLLAAAPPAGPDPVRVAGLVDQLDDDDYFVRQKADDQLRAIGRALLPLLPGERLRTPSPEARHRIDRLSTALKAADRVAGVTGVR